MFMNIDVTEVTNKEQMKEFIELPYKLYRGHKTWTPPLRMMEKVRFDPKKNPGLERIDPTYFLAHSGTETVGRIAAFLNHEHLELYGDATGHFGFLDVNPGFREIVGELLESAAAWLRSKGMEHMAGPYNFSVNEECGMLISGFDTPQMMLMPHGREDYPIMMEQHGFEKAMDMYAYLSNVHEGYPRPDIIYKMQKLADRQTDVSFRPMNKNDFVGEVKLAMDIFNDSWSENWGFVPYSDAQVQHMANELKMLIVPEGFWFAEKDGEAIGFVMLAPNLNEALAGLEGRLFPFGWAKLLWRLKVKGTSTGRVPLMGIRKSIQKKRTGTLVMLNLFELCYNQMRARGYSDIELSWILEPNKDVQNMIALCNAQIYKTYRIWKKAL